MSDTPIPVRTRTVTWDDPRPARRVARQLSGKDFFDAMRRGEVPEPPFGRLLGIDLFDVGDGRFVMTLEPQEYHYNPMGCVHGGILSTLLDSAMSGAVHTALPAGKGYLTLEIKVNFHSPVFEHTGEIMAEGKVITVGRQIATAEGRIYDRKNIIYATGTATCLIMEPPGPKTE